MMMQKSNSKQVKVSVLVPQLFLKRFGKAIEGFFPCRSEAVRRGMNLVMEEILKIEGEEAHPAQPESGG